MFHRRHARQTAEAWAKYLQSGEYFWLVLQGLRVFLTPVPASRKLGLIYLANEVVQQSRAKRKEEFVKEFAKVCCIKTCG
jgi:regulator of Ty1 transposition protein 103